MGKTRAFAHLHTVNKHRWLVFLHCCRVGIPWRGLVHDLSKYSPAEFWSGAKNYSGDRSPIAQERKAHGGYSYAFIHHTRRNKHHFEYWVDVTTGDVLLVPMPYSYALEEAMDIISASQTYNKKNFSRDKPLAFFRFTESKSLMHETTKEFIRTILERYQESGFKELHRKQTKELYQKALSHYPGTEKIALLSRDDIKIEFIQSSAENPSKESSSKAEKGSEVPPLK